MYHKLKLEISMYLLFYIGGIIMDDFRFLQDNSLWLVIIAIFVLLLLSGNGCNSFGGGTDCLLGGLFNGCGNNTWLWIVIIVLVIWFISKNDCGIFRKDLQ